MKKLLLLAIVVLGISAVSFGQGPIKVDASVKTSANIITPISIEKGQELMFGTIIASTENGTVTVGTDGTADYDGGASTQTAIKGQIQAGSFLVKGEKDATFSITLPSTFTLTGPTGADPMTVDGFVTDPDGTGSIAETGTPINVGATLHVNASQKSGLYSNPSGLVITVNYN